MADEKKFWELPDFERPCGPDEVAKAFISYRSFQKYAKDFTNVSDSGLTQLIRLCYHVSMAQEEGRFPRFRLRTTKKELDAEFPYANAVFEPKIKLGDVEDLRKLAPAVSSFDYCLGVIEEDGDLFCSAHAVAQTSTLPHRVGWPGITNSSWGHGAYIRVNSPGELDVLEGALAVKLRRGDIVSLTPFWAYPILTEWTDELSDKSHASITATNASYKNMFGGKEALRGLTNFIWASVLTSAAERFRGAAFVILPSDLPPSISLKYKTSSAEIGKLIEKYWLTCCEYDGVSGKKEIERAIANCLAQYEALLIKAKSMANMGQVDGCVVMTRDFRVAGFGGKINIGKEEADEANLKFTTYRDKRPREEAELNKFGTRHRSAFWFCKCNPGAIVFVVSQDGDVRAFASDSKHFYLFDRLSGNYSSAIL